VSRIVLVVVVVLIIAVAGTFAFELLGSKAPSSSVWSPAADYPIAVDGTIAIAGQQCVNSTAYIYCVGGQDANVGPRDEVFSARASGNISGWTEQTPYPKTINGQSCVAYTSYLYCVGGTNDVGGDDIAASYFAAIGSQGTLGTWEATTAFPIPIDSQSCTAYGGYIFCVGGNNETDGTDADSTSSNSAWYAQLSSDGLGTWMRTTAYPQNVFFPSCYSSGGYIFCIGGVDSNYNPVSSVYYASLSSNGIGAWAQTTTYPLQASGQACAVSSGALFCVGGEQATGSYTSAAYYAEVSSNGVGGWSQASSYPVNAQTDCAISSGYLYCVGGFDSSAPGQIASVFYASLGRLRG